MADEHVIRATQCYLEALKDLNTALIAHGLQMPMPMAVRIGQKPPKGCFVLAK